MRWFVSGGLDVNDLAPYLGSLEEFNISFRNGAVFNEVLANVLI